MISIHLIILNLFSKTVTLRQPCIYGPNQFGIEDQGWISWFIMKLLKNEEIKIYETQTS